MSTLPKLRGTAVKEYPDNDGSQPLRVENREAYARLRAGGESQRGAARRVNIARTTAETWEDRKSPTGAIVLRRIEFLRKEASSIMLPSPETFLHKLYTLSEEAREAGKFDVAAKVMFKLREIAMEQEDRTVPTFGEDVSDEDLDGELEG